MRRIAVTTVLFALTVLGTLDASADTTIISVGGTVVSLQVLFTTPASPPVSGAEDAAVGGWSQTSSATNVSIAAMLDSTVAPYTAAFSGDAFLMSQVGSGTTTAEQLATASYSVPANSDGLVTLFSGLDLLPGTYFLVVDVTSGVGGWDGSTYPPVLITASGVTFLGTGSREVGFSGAAPYTPSINFDYGTYGNQLEFTVTSVDTAALAPEPPAIALCGTGLLVITLIATKKKRLGAAPTAE